MKSSGKRSANLNGRTHLISSTTLLNLLIFWNTPNFFSNHLFDSFNTHIILVRGERNQDPVCPFETFTLLGPWAAAAHVNWIKRFEKVRIFLPFLNFLIVTHTWLILFSLKELIFACFFGRRSSADLGFGL